MSAIQSLEEIKRLKKLRRQRATSSSSTDEARLELRPENLQEGKEVPPSSSGVTSQATPPVEPPFPEDASSSGRGDVDIIISNPDSSAGMDMLVDTDNVTEDTLMVTPEASSTNPHPDVEIVDLEGDEAPPDASGNLPLNQEKATMDSTSSPSEPLISLSDHQGKSTVGPSGETLEAPHREIIGPRSILDPRRQEVVVNPPSSTVSVLQQGSSDLAYGASYVLALRKIKELTLKIDDLQQQLDGVNHSNDQAEALSVEVEAWKLRAIEAEIKLEEQIRPAVPKACTIGGVEMLMVLVRLGYLEGRSLSDPLVTHLAGDRIEDVKEVYNETLASESSSDMREG